MKKLKKEHFRKYLEPFREIVFQPKVYRNYFFEKSSVVLKRDPSNRNIIEDIIKRSEQKGYYSKYLIRTDRMTAPKNFSYKKYESVFIDFARIGKYINVKVKKDNTKIISITEETIEKILEFIKKYGLLGEEYSKYESAGLIVQEMIDAYNLLTLYNAILNKDLEQLKKRILIGDPYPFIWEKRKLEETFSPIIDGKKYTFQIMFKKPINYTACAFYHLACEISNKLNGVKLGFGNIEKRKVNNWPEDIDYPGIYFNSVLSCPSLLSYMYLRLYFVITSIYPLITCKECGIPFFPKRIKKDNKFCSNYCRLKNWKRINK